MPKMFLPRLLIGMVICVTFFSGCGKPEGPELGLVTGLISANGEPLSGVMVIFEPEGGRASYCKTKEDGRYELRYTSTRKGAEIAKHKVLLEAAEVAEGSSQSHKIPSKYNSKSTLVAEVKPGKNQFDFDITLSSKPGKASASKETGE